MARTAAERKMIVLGAGASIGGCLFPKQSSLLESIGHLPSAQNFFYDLFRVKATQRSRERYINMLGLSYGGVNKLIVRAFGLDNNLEGFDPSEWKGVNIEDVFTFLDIGEKTYNPGTDYYKAFSRSKEFLEDFIFLMLSMRCDDRHCEFLIDLFSQLQACDTIVSFNWDTIADESLRITNPDQYQQYVRMLSGQSVAVRELAKAGQFLKLHGSLNWLVCRNRTCLAHRRPLIPFGKATRLPRYADSAFERCPLCGASRPRRLIVPPVSNKIIQKGSFLHKLWLVAREQLAQTTELVFIGYSFPPTDFHAEWLFRQLRFLDRPKPRITVVNPEMFRSSSMTAGRYKSIFRGFTIRPVRSLKAYVEKLRYA